jgi:hypothetical protein
MGKLKLQHKYDDVRKYLESIPDNEMAAIIAKEQKNVREGVSDERRKECVAYGMYFHIEDDDLRKSIQRDSEWQDEYVANLFIKVCKDMGIYDQF